MSTVPASLKKAAPWLAGMLGLFVLVLVALMRTASGHAAVEWLVAKASGGEIVITGLKGALPNHIQAARIELRDAGGVWLRADRVALDWRAVGALWNHIVIRRLSADRISVQRWPQASASDTGSTPRIDIDALALPQIALGAPLAGQPAMLAARGSVHYVSRHDLGADMVVTRQGSSDRYSARGRIVQDVASGRITIVEGADGLLGRLAGLPGLNPVNLTASALASRDGNRISLRLTAGKLSAQGGGILRLAERRADLAFTAEAPAMRLAAALGWASLSATGRLTGSFDAPDVRGDVRLVGFDAGAYRTQALAATLDGAGGRIDASLRLEGLQIPGNTPGLLAQAPVLGKVTADLSDARRPLRFSLHHPLAGLEGTAHTRGGDDVEARLTVPSLAPLAGMAGGDIAGSASASFKVAFNVGKTTASLQGDIQAQGTAIPARLLGHATVSAHAVLSGRDIVTSQLTLGSASLASHVTGDLRGGRLNFRSVVTLKDFSRLAPALNGQGTLSGRITGPADKAVITASGTVDLAAAGSPRERMSISLHAIGLPPQSAALKARGRFNKAPLALDATLARKGADSLVEISGDWKSVVLRAHALLPSSGAATGNGTIDVKSLDDLAVAAGSPLRGALRVTAHLTAPAGKTVLALKGRASDMAVAGTTMGLVTIDGVVTDPFAGPRLSATIQGAQFSAEGWTGRVNGKIQGPLDALALEADAKLMDPQGKPADLAAGAMLDWTHQRLTLRRMKVDWHGESLVLSAPSQIRLAGGVSFDSLKVTGAGGSLAVSGQISPRLDVTFSARGIRAEVVSLFLPQFSASGSFSATAQLQGTLASPQGVISLQGRALRNRVYAVTAASAADLDARAVLHGRIATVTATLTAGKSAQMRLSGEAPLDAGNGLDLHLVGNADLVLLDPLLAAGGQRLRGKVQVDTAVSGSVAAPRVRGSANLSGGEFQDFARGIRLRDMTASLRAGKDGIHLVALNAHAGSGTVSGSGTLDAWSPGMPVDITLRATNARPIVSDLLTAVLSGSARLTGRLQEDMVLKGAIAVSRAEVTLPQSFPPQVRTLNVRHRGAPPPQAPHHGTSVSLDLTVRTTGPVTLRGRGIDADLGGNLDISGLAQAPRIGGGFEMRRGTLTLAGQVLSFTSGKITFNGTGVRGRMDPALDFVASETSGGVTAILAVGGYASQPKITLSSSPQLPQDEVLARLLFQQSAKQLGPLQLAEGAQALASIAGIGSGFSPLATLRGGLGLDRLSVGSGAGPASGASVEAGKYVSRNVYIGARQNVSGGTQAQVQIDLTKNLKAQATVNAGVSATATQGATAAVDNGNSVGLSYQFEY